MLGSNMETLTGGWGKFRLNLGKWDLWCV